MTSVQIYLPIAGDVGNRHSINTLGFHQIVQQQLGKDLDQDCEPLGKQGARGALFKITLTELRYTLIGKGTVKAFTRDLRHEGQMYQRLEYLQGRAIPVYLGNIDLLKVYYMDVGILIQHMMPMSWGGENAETVKELDRQMLKDQVQQSTNEMYRAGGDIRDPNTLWSRELGRIMLIDFERASLIRHNKFDGIRNQEGKILREMSVNRKGKWHESGTGGTVKSPRAEFIVPIEIKR